ncbi:MAG: N-acetylmuramoyl-L-alanine amidase [Clostridia bacterium]|nr:N-acetylmuramoyl-L-alanine amidase [Clostridia bacterium]
MTSLKIKRSEIEKIDIANIQGGFTASQVMDRYKPDIIINLALYDMASLTNITKMLDENKESGYLFSDEGIYIDVNNNIGWCTFNEARADSNKDDYISGSPILVKNGAISIEWGNKVSSYLLGSHKRSILGFNDDEVVLISTDEVTLEKAAKIALDSGCKYAINLDGGGSCHLQEGNRIYTGSARRNVSWLMIYKKNTNEEVLEMAKKVCIDAGHGKSTSGKRSPDGKLKEYEFNRDVAKRIKTILEAHGVDVTLTCTGDTDVSLTQRAKTANNAKVDCFVSIHANAHGNGVTWTTAQGWEIYVCAKGGKAEKLAKAIQKHSIPELGLKDRGIKEANYTVLTQTSMPAVLVEHGFFTNKEECEKLKSDSFRQKCAEADAKGILEYLGITYKEKAETNTDSKFPYKVKITANLLNVRKDAGTNYPVTCTVKHNEVYTIVGEKQNGSTTWLKLKSGLGYISSKYTKRV